MCSRKEKEVKKQTEIRDGRVEIRSPIALLECVSIVKSFKLDSELDRISSL